MLREVKNVRFGRRLTLLGWRYFHLEGDRAGDVVWRRRAFEAMQAEQESRPVELFRRDGRTYWTFEHRVFWEDDDLGSRDVLALVRERQRRARRALDRAHAGLAGEAGGWAEARPPSASRKQATGNRQRATDNGQWDDVGSHCLLPVARCLLPVSSSQPRASC